MTVLNIPGWKNSRAGHWQTLWEADDPHTFSRIEQDEWLNPQKADWIKRIGETLSQVHSDVIITAHSIGVMAFVHAVQAFQITVKGALLVAPSDPESPDYPKEIVGFNPVPLKKLPFPTILVASTNDKAVSIERATLFARHWGSHLVIIENAGHFDPNSGYGEWAQGRELLASLY